MNITLIVLILAVQLPLMLMLPILVGWWIRRRYGVGWRLYLMGGPNLHHISGGAFAH
ncbi:MAG: hypothetical protein ACUVSF_02000 [Anaerolineae bacterium]